MLTVFLCDDNSTVLDNYKEKLTIIKDKYSIPMTIYSYKSGETMLFHMEDKHINPDIIYLDILLDNENGISIAKQLRENNSTSEIIFLTANPEFVFESFEAMPSNYIIKDTVSDKRFEEIFIKTAMKAEKKSKEIFTCSNNNEHKNIPFVDILYFEIINRIVTVHYTGGTFSFYSKLDDIEKKLGHRSFLRVHRSYLINMVYIEEIRKESIMLNNQEIIPMGITYIKQVKTAFNQYFNHIM